MRIDQLPSAIRTRGLGIIIKAIVRELWKYLLQGLFNKEYAKRNIFSFQMYLDLNDKGISRTLWLFGERELDHKWIMQQTLKPGDKVLDIGANIGYYVLLEDSLVGPSGRLIAVEPSETNVNLLERNLTLNSVKAQVICAAVSSDSGQKEFWLASASNLNTFHKEYLTDRGDSPRKVDVETLTVREICDKYGAIDYLRMDIEGHEVEVLDSIYRDRAALATRPSIVFETHTGAYNETHNIVRSLSQLVEIGYVFRFVASSSIKGAELLMAAGLTPTASIRTDDTIRTIFRDAPPQLVYSCLRETGGIRTIYLELGSGITQ
jgi:FkbM family methyltransferase